LKSNSEYSVNTTKGQLYKNLVDDIYPEISKEIYAIDKPYRQLGFPEEGGITGYFSRNM